jgi:hypothetical protein
VKDSRPGANVMIFEIFPLAKTLAKLWRKYWRRFGKDYLLKYKQKC